MPLLTFIPILLALDFSLPDQDRKIKVRQRFCVYHIFLFSHYQRTTISGEMVFQNQIAVIIHFFLPARQGHEDLSSSLKEVIQPQVPLRLPCYDFTPVADYTVVKGFKPCLKVEPTPMV